MNRTGISEIDQYVDGVISGRIEVCRFVRLACERHRNDLNRVKSDPDFPYYFEPKAARHIFDFYQLLRHYKGEWAGKVITLEPWQMFFLGSVFGWLHKENRLRRLREATLEVPRKNGKTLLLAGVALYGLDYDGEEGAEIYTAATARDQAKLLWNDAKIMVEASPELSQRFKITIGQNTISYRERNSLLKPLSKDSGRLDGLNVHYGLNDELHAWPSRDLYDVIDSAMGARRQPLMMNITTAGNSTNVFYFEYRKYLISILEGSLQNDRTFALIYTLDREDLENNTINAWHDERLWKKANPNYGVSVLTEDMQRMADKSLGDPQALSNFLTKRLNIWTSARSAWMNMEWWGRAARVQKVEEFKGQPAYIAVDLSSKVDLSAIAVLVYDHSEKKYRTFSKSYMPSGRIKELTASGEMMWQDWAEKGYLTATPGEMVDYEYIRADILALYKTLDVISVGADPYNATQLITQLQADGIEVIEVNQRVSTLSEPMKQLFAEVKNETLWHDNNPVANHAMGNVVTKTDFKGNIFPAKESPKMRIDPSVALINAFALELAKSLKTFKKKSLKIIVL